MIILTEMPESEKKDNDGARSMEKKGKRIAKETLELLWNGMEVYG